MYGLNSGRLARKRQSHWCCQPRWRRRPLFPWFSVLITGVTCSDRADAIINCNDFAKLTVFRTALIFVSHCDSNT